MTNNEAEISIDLAAPEDGAAILKLTKQLVTESDTFTIDPELAELTVAEEQRQIMLINQTRSNVMLVAHYGDEVIGLVTVQQLADSDYGELGVAVLKQFWNHGIGTALVDEAINWGVSYSNLNCLVLTVEKRNAAAIHIYHQLGFLDHPKQRIIDVTGSGRSTIEMIYAID